MSNPNIYYEGREVRFKINKIGKVIFPKRAIKAGDFAILSVYPLDNEEGQIYVHPTWGNCTIKGKVRQLVDGEEYEIIATEVPQDPKYGQGWEYNIIKMSSPSSKQLKDNSEGRTFLKAIFTDNQYAMLTSIDNPIELLEKGDSKELSKIKGIGKTTANKMISKYNSLKECSSDVLAFAKLDLTDNEVKTIMEYYDDNSTIAIQSIKDNPYCLTDIKGFGFKKVDDIALRNGLVGEHDKRRVKAYIIFLFEDMASNEGSTWTWTDNVFDCVISDLEMEDEELIAEGLRELVDEEKLWTNKDHSKLALKKYRELEENIAKELIRISKGHSKLKFSNWEDKLKGIEKEQGWELNKEQVEGAKSIMNNQITIITGMGGTGKTSSLKATLNMCDTSLKVALVCMSGKASAVLSEATGLPASTIHRCLGFTPNGFVHDKKNKLDVDLICIDESGMLNLPLLYSLLQAIPDDCKLVMIGDLRQLPPVGVGKAFEDIVNSNVFSRVDLVQIHRQAKNSNVKMTSYKIANGEQILKDMEERTIEEGDLKIITIKDKDFIKDKVLQEYKELLDQGIDIDNITVIGGVKDKGETSAYNLNNEIQSIIYGEDIPFIEINKNKNNYYKIHEGERIMNLSNNYEIEKYGIDYSEMDNKERKENYTEIFNGQTATIESIDIINRKAVALFDDGNEVVLYDKELSNCCLGFCGTTHKYQGSQNDYIIGVVDYGSYKLLSKQWLYTMISRCKKGKCILIGQPSAIKQCLKTNNLKNINTFLSSDLKNLTNKLK